MLPLPVFGDSSCRAQLSPGALRLQGSLTVTQAICALRLHSELLNLPISGLLPGSRAAAKQSLMPYACDVQQQCARRLCLCGPRSALLAAVHVRMPMQLESFTVFIMWELLHAHKDCP